MNLLLVRELSAMSLTYSNNFFGEFLWVTAGDATRKSPEIFKTHPMDDKRIAAPGKQLPVAVE